MCYLPADAALLNRMSCNTCMCFKKQKLYSEYESPSFFENPYWSMTMTSNFTWNIKLPLPLPLTYAKVSTIPLLSIIQYYNSAHNYDNAGRMIIIVIKLYTSWFKLKWVYDANVLVLRGFPHFKDLLKCVVQGFD